MLKQMLALGVLLVGGSVASAAIIYEPVQYQYRDGATGVTYYYGGRHHAIVADAVGRSYALRHTDANYQPGNFAVHTEQTTPVYSDAAPHINLAPYGYTATDAMNEANANVPRYFRMRDLIPAGRVTPDGTLVVPADARPIEQPMPKVTPTTKSSAQSIIIIPKRPPTKAAELKVADASK